MALPHLRHQTRIPSIATLATLESALSSLRLHPSTLIGHRHASHQAQGRANGAADGPGKRLGAKKASGAYVVPGNILFKQRGTLWFPGEGCFMGRDHTIHAEVPGYVRFYRDPERHKKRKYIGVVFEKENVLPQPRNSVRRRMLGMLAYQMPKAVEAEETGDITSYTPSQPSVPVEQPQESRQTRTIRSRRGGSMVDTKLTLRPGYQWRQANWEIGKQALESKQARRVKAFVPGDRFKAWQKRNVRIAKNAERRAMKGKGGKKRN